MDKKKDITASSADIPLVCQKNVTDAMFVFGESLKKGLRICVPASVVSYDRASRRVEVMPLVKYCYYTPAVTFKMRGNYYCTMMQHTSGGFSCDAPVYKGDTGWVITSDWSTAYLKQSGTLTATVLKSDRTDDVMEKEYQSSPNDMRTHDIGEGFFIPDSWALFNIGRCKDVVGGFDSNSLYMGSAFTTSDKYHPDGSFEYQLNETCSISMTRDGILHVAHSLPKRNHTNIDLKLETGELEITGIHEKRNNDEFELPLESETLKDELEALKASEPDKFTTKDSEKKEKNGEGFPGVSKKWDEWKKQYDKLDEKQKKKEDAEEKEEAAYDYGKEKPIKTRKTVVSIKPNRSEMSVSYVKKNPDSPTDEEEESEEKGVGDGAYTEEQPWTKETKFTSTPMREKIWASYTNVIEKKSKEISLELFSGATEENNNPCVKVDGKYINEESKVTKSHELKIAVGSEDAAPAVDGVLKYENATENEEKKATLKASCGDEDEDPVSGLELTFTKEELVKKASSSITTGEGEEGETSFAGLLSYVKGDTEKSATVDFLGGGASKNPLVSIDMQSKESSVTKKASEILTTGENDSDDMAFVTDMSYEASGIKKTASLNVIGGGSSNDPNMAFTIKKDSSGTIKQTTCSATTETANFITKETGSNNKSTKVDVTTTSLNAECKDANANKTATSEMDIEHFKNSVVHSGGKTAYAEVRPGKITLTETDDKTSTVALDKGNVSITCDKDVSITGDKITFNACSEFAVSGASKFMDEATFSQNIKIAGKSGMWSGCSDYEAYRTKPV